jgi:hypothetical protein
MSRGPGHVERSIRQLFYTHPDEAFSLKDVVEWCWPDVIPGEKHRISAARAAKAVVAKDVDWVSRAIPGGTTWFWNMASPQSVAMYDMLGASRPRSRPGKIMSGRGGRVPRPGSNSRQFARDEALERLQPGGADYQAVRDLEAVCARHRGRRSELVGLTTEERLWDSHVAEVARRLLPERGRALLDNGWTSDEIAEVYQRAQAVADRAFNKFLDRHTGAPRNT